MEMGLEPVPLQLEHAATNQSRNRPEVRIQALSLAIVTYCIFVGILHFLKEDPITYCLLQ